MAGEVEGKDAMKIISQIWNEIRQGENIDVYLTIGAAIILSMLSLMGWNVGDKVAGVTLAVLALLAIGNLVNRHKFEAMLERHFGSTFFMKSYPKDTWRKDLETAKEIWLIGQDLGRLIEGERLLLESCIQKGGVIRVLIVNPDDLHAIEYMRRANTEQEDVNEIQGKIRLSLAKWRKLAKSHEAKVEIRLIDHPLAFGTNAINLGSNDGKIYLDLYKYKVEFDGRVKLILSPIDKVWYEVYREQIFALWNDSKPFAIDG